MGDYYTTDIIAEEFGEGAGAILVFYLIYMLVALAVSVGTYVLQSLGLYSIAKRRGIHHPWLSWIPIGSTWILGCISDQFQYVVKGKVKNKRKALLALNIIMWVSYVLFFVLFFIFLFSSVDLLYGDALDANWGALVFMLLSGLVMMGTAIAIIVLQYIALYDLYTSCEPKNNVLYLVLGIFVSICQPIFLFVCRNKDEGMPPRKQQPAAYIPQQPTWEPTEGPTYPEE